MTDLAPVAAILAGDVGGTKTDLSLLRLARGGLEPVREGSYPSAEFGSLAELVLEFLQPGETPPDAAAFGVPGPVLGDVIRLTNLPWTIDREQLSRSTGIERIRLLNDLEAAAYGVLAMSPEHTVTLNQGVERPGHRVVIAAGTGLGQAILHWDGSAHRPVATEGGHAGFAPRDEEQIELFRFLHRRYDRVSWERVLSGPGLESIFDFYSQGQGHGIEPAIEQRIEAGEPVAAVVGEAGVAGTSATCRRAVDLFLRLYGAQAANLALTTFALGGVYVGGGIIRKMLPRAADGPFREGFLDVGRFRDFVESIPVHAIREPRTAVEGAARVAAELARSAM